MADVGTNKSNILEARIWLKDIKRDFAAMNGVLFICDEISKMTTILFVKVKVHNIVNTGLERLGGPGEQGSALLRREPPCQRELVGRDPDCCHNLNISDEIHN